MDFIFQLQYSRIWHLPVAELVEPDPVILGSVCFQRGCRMLPARRRRRSLPLALASSSVAVAPCGVYLLARPYEFRTGERPPLPGGIHYPPHPHRTALSEWRPYLRAIRVHTHRLRCLRATAVSANCLWARARLYQMLFVTLGFVPRRRNSTARAAALCFDGS